MPWDDTPPACSMEQANAVMTELLASAASSNVKLSSETVSETSETKTKSYKWRIFSIQSVFEGLTFTSKETGVQEFGADGFWRWKTFGHDNVSISGSATLWDAEITTLSAAPTIANINVGPPSLPTVVSIAGMQLDYTVKIDYECGVVLRREYKTAQSSNSWYTYE